MAEPKIIECRNFNILKNRQDDVMILIQSEESSEDNPILYYNGDKDALLCKNNNVHIHMDYIHPEARKFLFSAKNVLIVEVNNGSIIREYNVPVNTEK